MGEHGGARRHSTDGDCCSTVEQIWLMRGGMRVGDAKQDGWRVSDAERLTDLTRRDIQRCCYEGEGGVGILSPESGTWGRRTYSRTDLATLFVVARHRRRGLTLPQVKAAFEDRGGKKNLGAMLDEERERLADELAALLERYLGALAFSATLEDDAEARLSQLFAAVATARLATRPGDEGRARPERPRLEDVLDQPGVEVLVELWLGPGSYERLQP
jgi:DNA-binding transcriptional MerR regulator